MGKNDHVPVPDPKPRPPETPPVPYPGVAPPTKAPAPIGGPTTSSETPGPTITSSRLHTLEKNWKNHIAEVVSLKTSMVKLSESLGRQDIQSTALHNHIDEIAAGMANLHRLLKQTATGVERLAQGHSQGNLGLPTEEDWRAFEV